MRRAGLAAGCDSVRGGGGEDTIQVDSSISEGCGPGDGVGAVCDSASVGRTVNAAASSHRAIMGVRDLAQDQQQIVKTEGDRSAANGRDYIPALLS
jgi:hypothetical protein